MTGELTLTGEVLAVGGIREKIIAARRIGINEVILPEANRNDFEELPKHISKDIKAHFAKRYTDVYEVLFELPRARKGKKTRKKTAASRRKK